MADEFTPEASVDFEAMAALAAEAVNGNGDGPHYAPPPEQPAQQAPPVRPRAAASAPAAVGDPFQTLAQIASNQELVFREFGELQTRMRMLQLQNVLAFGAALLLAVLVWKIGKETS